MGLDLTVYSDFCSVDLVVNAKFFLFTTEDTEIHRIFFNIFYSIFGDLGGLGG